MNLKPNIPETMIPGTYIAYNFNAGPNGLPANIQKLLLIGDISSSGTLAVDTPTPVYTENDADTLCGQGSVLHQMYKAAKKAYKYAQITLLRHAAPTGGAATVWPFTVTGSATDSGSVQISWNGGSTAVAVAKSATSETVANAIKAAINNEPNAPFTASVTETSESEGDDEYTVTLTAKCKGAYIDAAISISMQCSASGIALEASTKTAGTGTVDVEDALAAAFPERFHLIVLSVSDPTNLGYLKTHLENAAGPLENRGQRGITAMVANDVTSAITAAGKNYERICLAAVKTAIDTTPWEIAAGIGARFAANNQPNIPMNGAAITGLPVPATENKWTGEEQDALLYGGVIPLVEIDGELCMVRAVTTRSTQNGVRFTKLIDTGVIATLDYFRDAIRSMHKTKYNNAVIHSKLLDALNEDNIAIAKQLEDIQLLRNVDDYVDSFITQESDETGRVLCQIPAPVVPGLNQIYSTIDLYL